MKDAQGHGSDPRGGPHTEGIEQKVPKRYNTLAGGITISTRDPSTMTNGELNKEYENVTRHQSATTTEFINAGRGNEKPKDMDPNDPLVQKYRALGDRAQALSSEAHSRNTMGGRRVQSEDGRVKFVGKQPGSLKMGFYP